MLMNNGSYDGTEIIPESLINQLLEPTEPGPGYGITFWLNKPLNQNNDFFKRLPEFQKQQNTTRFISDHMPDDLFMMSGAFGQKLYICPSLNLIIVRFSSIFGNISDNEFFSILMDGVDQAALR